MNNTPMENVLTNEIRLVDQKGSKMSITFGEADISSGYSYLAMKFLAKDDTVYFGFNKKEIDFACEELFVSGSKVWNDKNHGPQSGLNADKLDGYHAFEFKDLAASHRFMHQFNTTSDKRFVKIATFNVRKVGDPGDYKLDGSPITKGIFAQMEQNEKIAFDENIKSFKLGTSNDLSTQVFSPTTMQTQGVYNGLFRGSITILKDSYPTTFDLHLGLFHDPTTNSTDIPSTKKFFYVSLHDCNLPYIDESSSKGFDATEQKRVYTEDLESQTEISVDDELKAKVEIAKEKMKFISGESSSKEVLENIEKIKEKTSKNARAAVSLIQYYENHDRPTESKASYATPPDPTKNYTKPKDFKAPEYVGDSYERTLDIARLIHRGTNTDRVDGITTIVHTYDLYIAIDSKAEVHVQPIMSAGCSFYKNEAPVLESQLNCTSSNTTNPTSIYDSRYAHKRHRHYDYEEKITNLIDEVDKIWDSFDHYVTIEQGIANAKKVLMTDSNGSVFAAEDNLERHSDSRRKGGRVLVTNTSKCISECNITTDDLAQLDGIRSNIQIQINEILASIEKIKINIIAIEGDIDNISASITEINTAIANIRTDIRNIIESLKGYVKKSGDSMSGCLMMCPSSESNGLSTIGESSIIFQQADKTAVQIYSSANNGATTFGLWDITDNCMIMKYSRNSGTHVQFAANAISIGGKKVTVSSSAPSSPSAGDVWIKSW